MATGPREVIYVEIYAGEALSFEIPARALDSEKIYLTLESKSGQKARLRISADKSVTIGKQFGARRPVPA